MPMNLRPGTTNVYDLSQARHGGRLRFGLGTLTTRNPDADGPRIEWGSSHYHATAIRDAQDGPGPKRDC